MSNTRTIRGKDHELVVLFVTESDAHGRPLAGKILYDEDVHKVTNGDTFITVYIPSVNTRKRS